MIELVVAALATWRISAWLWHEDGAEGIREWVCLRSRWACRQVTCFWCVTFWVGLVVSPVVLTGLWWVLVPAALSGAAILASGGGRLIWRDMVSE